MWSHTSASQVEQFDKCERAWYFKQIDRLPEPKKGHQAFGTALHRIVETQTQGLTWEASDVPEATQEQWTKAQRLAAEMIKLLPPVITHHEAKIEMPTYEGGPVWIGYVDIGIAPGHGWPQLMIGPDPGVGIIGDLKTTSDFKYMKSPQELADSVQMTSYAKWAIEAPGLVAWNQTPPDKIYLAHVYGLTKGEKISEKNVRHSLACVDREHIEAKWSNTLDKVRRMSKVALSGDAKRVEATGALTGHCQAYGGCAFREKCGIADNAIGRMFNANKLVTLGEKTVSNAPATGSGTSLMDRIKAARAGAQGNNASTAPQNAPATGAVQQAQAATPVAGASGNGASANVGTVGGTQVPGNPVVDQPGTGSSVASPVAPVTGIIPPDAPPRDQPAHTITQPGSVGQAVSQQPVGQSPVSGNVTQDKMATAGVSTPATTPTSGATVSDAGASGEPAQEGSGTVSTGGKRGRPSKAETEAKRAQEEAEFKAKVDAAVEAELARRLNTMGITMSQGETTANDEALAAEVQKLIEENEKLKVSFDSVATDNKSHQAEIAQLRQIRDRLVEEGKESAKTISAQAEALSRAQAGQSAATNAKGEPQGLTVYIDAYPMFGGDLSLWESWSAPVAERAAELGEVPDWRLINYTSRGVFATAMREHIKANGLPKAMYINSAASGADIGLEILIPLASKVIKGVR